MSRSALPLGAVVLCALASVLAAPAANAASSWPSVTAVTPGPMESGSDAGAKPGAEAPVCTRKVKVVYSGYGEAERAGCATASTAATAVR